MSVDDKPIFKLLPDARNTVVLHLTNESVYGYTAPHDGTDSVFAAWIARSEVAASAGNFTSTPGNKDIITSPRDMTQLNALAA